MGSISASIQLYDRMSAPLQNIMSALNMTISSMRDMQSTMGSDMDTSSLDAATQAANQAQAAMEALSGKDNTNGAKYFKYASSGQRGVVYGTVVFY